MPSGLPGSHVEWRDPEMRFSNKLDVCLVDLGSEEMTATNMIRFFLKVPPTSPVQPGDLLVHPAKSRMFPHYGTGVVFVLGVGFSELQGFPLVRDLRTDMETYLQGNVTNAHLD
jgi:hypothetical protein